MTGKVAAVVVAAGRGRRVGGDLPKQYRLIAGQPMLRTPLSVLVATWIDVVGAGHRSRWRQ